MPEVKRDKKKKSYWDVYLPDVFFGQQATPDQGAPIKTEVA